MDDDGIALLVADWFSLHWGAPDLIVELVVCSELETGVIDDGMALLLALEAFRKLQYDE